MIDIDALKRDKRPQSSTIVHALIGRLEAAESECLEEARLNGMGSEREAALMAKLEAAEKDRSNFLLEMGRLCAQCDALRAKIEATERERDFAKTEIARLHDDIRELTDERVLDEEDRERIVAHLQGEAKAKLDSLEATEKDSAHHKALAESALRVAKGWEDKCDDLRAKIEAMEKQEPVAKVRVHQTGGNAGIAWSVAPLNDFDALPLMRDGSKLYALPGAQTQGEEK